MKRNVAIRHDTDLDYGIRQLIITICAGGPYDFVGRAAGQLCKLDWAITNDVPAALVIL